MEITPFPSLNLQDDDCSQFFSLFTDMDQPFENGGENYNPNSKKRPRKEEDGDVVSNSGYGDILASLMLLEEKAKQEQVRWDFESEKERAELKANHVEKVRTMNNYHNQMQESYSGLERSENLRSKRARTNVVSAAVAVAGGGEETITGGSKTGQRRLWVRERRTDWWDRVDRPDFPEEEFRREFRMSRSTFNQICEELDAAVTKKTTTLREAIPAPKRVAVCIWRLATGAPLRQVSERFGLGISTCHKLVIDVCHAIHTVLMPKYLRWPSDAQIQTTKSKFESDFKIPNVAGSIYTTHIPIIAPKAHVTAYFNKRQTDRNQKTSYSITVQGVVDRDGIFTDVCIGNPGSLSDGQILEKSSLFRQRASRGLLRDIWIVGNSGFPLSDWLLVPYTHQNLTWTQHGFNERIGEIHGVAKEAFGRLKGRWACLQKRTEVKLQDLPYVLGACCVLHNICEMNKEVMSPELKFDAVDDETVPENNLRSVNAMQARDDIAHNLLHRGLAGTGFL